MTSAPERRGDLLPDWLRWRSAVSAGSLALKAGGVEWTYAELQRRVSALASVLSRKVKPGDRVALLMSPSEHYIASIHAVARLGAVCVPLNHRQSIPELLSQLKDSTPSLVVYDDALGAKAKAAAASPRPGRWARVSDLTAASASRDREPLVGDHLDPHAPHAIIYTSGSSAASKGVVLTLSNLMWNAVSVGLRVGGSPDDRWLLCLPLFHIGGYSIVFRAILHGSGVVIHPRFDPKKVSLSLDNDGVTLASFVPTMLTDVLQARGRKPLSPKVRLVFVGGGRPSPNLATAIRERKLPVLLTYGMTETCSQVAVSNAWSSSAGPEYQSALPSEVTVTKPAGRGRVALAQPGEVGEVAVRGPTVFQGYWRKPGLTRSRFSGGWFLTGDLGVLQPVTGRRAVGGLAILGRKEETIVSGGEKVFPAEVEAALREHPGVKEAVVLGVDDPRWGQRVVAVVEAAPGIQPSEQELTSFLRDRVGRYKVPKQYHFWSDLPRTPTGKPRRAEIRQRLERGASSP